MIESKDQNEKTRSHDSVSTSTPTNSELDLDDHEKMMLKISEEYERLPPGWRHGVRGSEKGPYAPFIGSWIMQLDLLPCYRNQVHLPKELEATR